MMHNTKAQVAMQVLIFVIAGVILMLIVGYGYKAVTYFIEKQEQVVLADFHLDLKVAIENIKRQPGSIRKLHLGLPSDKLGVCFLGDECGVGASLETNSGSIEMGWATQSCKKTKANVFMYPRVGDEPMLDIVVDSPGFVCIPNQGGITVKLEGLGRKAKVSEWVN